MKKILSVLCLMTILGSAVPTFAAPPPGGGRPGVPGGHGAPRGPERVIAGHNHIQPPPVHHGKHFDAPPPPPKHHSHGSIIVGGVLARRGCWNDSYYNYRVGWYDDFCFPPPPPPRYYRQYNNSAMYVNFGIPIRF